MTRKSRCKGVYIGITDEQDVLISALQAEGLKLNYLLEKGLENLAPKLSEGLKDKLKDIIS